MNTTTPIIKRLVIICLLVFIAITACSCGAETPLVIHSNTEGNSLQNIDNEGFVAMQEDYLYYYRESPSKGLYRSKLDGSGTVKLTDGFVSNINVVGDTLYYVKDEFVSKTSEEIKDLYRFQLYCADLNGSNEKKLIEDCTTVYVTGDCIYYLYEIDYIAYRYDNKPIPNNYHYLYRYDLKTQKNELLVDRQLDTYRISGNELYYTVSDSNRIYHTALMNAAKEKPDVVYRPEEGEADNTCTLQFAILPGKRLLIGDMETLFLYDIQTAKKEMLTKDYPGLRMMTTDAEVYSYEDDSLVKKFDLNTKKTEDIHLEKNSATPYLYVFRNQCYFHNGLDAPKVI